MIELYMLQPGQLMMREQAPEPAPGPGQVVIKVLYGGICGSDLRVYKGSVAYAQYPGRAGHEALGVVTAVGTDTSFAVGQKVVTFPNTFCGKCEFCRTGKTNLCQSKQSFGINAPGVFASEITVDHRFLTPVPAGMPDKRAVLTEPFAVTVHALKKAQLQKGMSVAIVGCGTEGLLSTVFANYMGADITIIDVNPRKFPIAKKIGDVRTAGYAEIAGETFDVVVEAAGVKQSIEQAMQLVKPGGTLVMVGITGEQVEFPVIHIVRNEITIYGSIIYTKDDFAETLKLLADPALPIEPIVSKIVPATEYQQAYAYALTGDFAKIILDFQDQ